MGLRSLVGAPEVRAIKDAKWGKWAAGEDVLVGGNTAAGVQVSPESSLQSLAVHGCVNLITSTLSTLPRHTFTSDGDESVKVPAPRWLERPSPEADWMTFVSQFTTSLLLDGNAYVAVRRDAAFRTQELVAVHPSRVTVQRAAEGAPREYLIDGAVYRGELVHVPATIVRPNALKGLSPIDAAREAIGLEIAGREYGARFFGQGAHLSGVIEVPGEMTDEQAAVLARTFGAKHGGLRKAHLPGVITGGGEWKPITVTPEQAQFLESRRFSASEIASLVFLVDPAMLGIAQSGTSVTYANLESRGVHFVQFTMLPWISRLENLVTGLLPARQFLKLNVDGLMRADLKSRYEAHKIGIDAGFLTPNEARGLEDLPPMSGDAATSSPQELALVLQKIYLAVGKVITAEEAREIVNRAGGNLADLPDGLPNIPVAMQEADPFGGFDA
jgi:HK97 family phage portal protein